MRATAKILGARPLCTHLNFASKSRKGKILRAVKNFNGPFITPKNFSETKCVLPLNILHCLFYIQKQKRLIPSLSFLFLFKILSMQNLIYVKHIVLLNF